MSQTGWGGAPTRSADRFRSIAAVGPPPGALMSILGRRQRDAAVPGLRGHPVITTSDPSVAVGRLERPDAPVSLGLHRVVVESLATAGVVTVPVTSLAPLGADFVVQVGDTSITVPASEAPDIQTFLQRVNRQPAVLKVTSDATTVTFTSQVAGAVEALRLTVGGAQPAGAADHAVAADASITVDGAELTTEVNRGLFGGIVIEAKKLGQVNLTVADSLAPRWVFPLTMLYLAAIPVVALIYHSEPGHIARFVPGRVVGVPTSVLLFGALGGVIISLQGIFDHNRSWLPSFNYWHIARPFVAAGLGLVAVLIFVALNDATKSGPAQNAAPATTATTATTTTTIAAPPPTTTVPTPVSPTSTVPIDQAATSTPSTSNPSSSSNSGSTVVYDVIAFLVGYSEQTFRNLLTKITGVLIGPGTDAHATAAVPASGGGGSGGGS